MTRTLPLHGTLSRYTHWGCRCDDCRRTMREYNRKRRGSKPRPPLKPHGTDAAYHRHLVNHDPPCDACRAAHTAYEASRRRRAGVMPLGPLRPHGTMAAYVRHLRHGERACDPCREANLAHGRAWRERKRKERAA